MVTNQSVLINVERVILLTATTLSKLLFRSLRKIISDVEIIIIHSYEDMKRYSENNPKKNDILLSFGSGIIVSKEILQSVGLAINIHAASPKYPGRDPHHFAAYDNTEFYGATAHYMEEKVDSGSIIGVRLVKVDNNMNANELLKIANEAGIDLFNELIESIFVNQVIPESLDIQWAQTKTSRKKFQAMCNVNPNISEKEFERLYKAFQLGSTYKNLFIELHGHIFKYEGKL